MQNKICKLPSSEGLDKIDLITSKFKTTRTALCFCLPITKENTAYASLLSKLLCRSTKRYPTPKLLKERLSMLYGAELVGSVSRHGDNMMLKISCISLCDKYALTPQSITKEVCSLLKEAVFEPNVSDGEFSRTDFEVEQRIVIEEIRSLINEKRGYAISKAIEKMCDGEPFGIMRDEKTVASVTPSDLYKFWQNLLKTAPAYIIHIGSESNSTVFSDLSEAFEKIDRKPLIIEPTFSPVTPKGVRDYSEQMEISQGKLVMGFRAESSSLFDNIAPLRVMTDIFGGSPYSKLFTVVRENMSLCYYCAARLYSAKGILLVDSGIEIDNLSAAKKGILDQLEAMKAGDFDEDVITASKIGLCDAIRSVEDTSGGIEGWYTTRLLEQNLMTTAAFIDKINAVTKDQIIAAAKGIKLDTVYVLKGKESE